jgi:hypothetical protein
MSSDATLVSRLRERGLRLDGLSFLVGAIRQRSAGHGRIRVETTVTTSAHRQVHAASGAVRAVIPASTRQVTLTLVPSADRRHWLVHAASGPEGS